MSILLAPIPIIHAQSMLDERRLLGYERFAFGSNMLPFFQKEFPENVELENVVTYIYVSLVRQKPKSSTALQIGVSLKANLCCWRRADNRTGQYHKDGKAHRPTSCAGDDAVSLFWEIENIEQLTPKKPMSDFSSVGTSKRYDNDYMPERPILVTL